MPRYTIVQALAQARLVDLHNQARRDALARAVRRARRARRQHVTRRATALLAALTRRARFGPGSGFTRPHPHASGGRLHEQPRPAPAWLLRSRAARAHGEMSF